MGSLHVEGLKVGDMHRIQYRPDSGRGRDLEMTAQYLDHTRLDHAPVELIYSLRPAAGTQRIRADHIKAIWRTTSVTPVLPHRVQAEDRLY